MANTMIEMPDDRDGLEKLRDECIRRLNLIDAYDDTFIQKIQSDPGFADVSPRKIRDLLDRLEKHAGITRS